MSKKKVLPIIALTVIVFSQITTKLVYAMEEIEQDQQPSARWEDVSELWSGLANILTKLELRCCKRYFNWNIRRNDKKNENFIETGIALLFNQIKQKALGSTKQTLNVEIVNEELLYQRIAEFALWEERNIKVKDYKSCVPTSTFVKLVRTAMENDLKFMYTGLSTSLPLELISRASEKFEPQLFLVFFRGLSRYRQAQHNIAYETFVAFLEPPTKHELSISPHVRTVNRELNGFTLSLLSNKPKIKFTNSSNEFVTESGSDSDAKEFISPSLYEKTITGQKNSETESNQDTNGTTDPKKENLKNATSIRLSSLSIESNSFNSHEGGINARKINVQDFINPFCKLTSEDFESLLGNDGACNNGANTEVSKDESYGDEPNLFLAYDSIAYHTHKPKKGSMNKRLTQKKIESEVDI